MMPLTVIKVRYESNFYAYRSLWGACRDILGKEGVRGFFSGFGATAIRDAPYAGLYVLFYEQCKRRLSVLTSRSDSSKHTPPDLSMKGSLSASINFFSGALAAGLATAITNPFDALKTRIQLLPGRYANMIVAARTVVAEDGFRALFDGLGLRIGRKVASSALAWTLYEEIIRRADGKLGGKTDGVL
jgi:solute carrier family 25 protein 38